MSIYLYNLLEICLSLVYNKYMKTIKNKKSEHELLPLSLIDPIIQKIKIKTRKDIYLFLEYINFPPISTSAIIIKNVLNNLANQQSVLNYQSIKEVVDTMHLDWNREKAFLRKSIKTWYKNNFNNFEQKFLNIFNKKPTTINAIASFFDAYKMNLHSTYTSYNIYNICHKTDGNLFDDRNVFRLNKKT